VAANVTLIAAGNYDWKKLVELAKRHCEGWQTGPAPREVSPSRGRRGFQVIAKETVAQEHLFMLSAAPPAHSQQRFAAEVLANILGDDSGSRLYWALIDPGLADSADVNYHEYEGVGVYYTYLSGEPERARDNLQVCLKVLAEANANGVTEQEVQLAKSKLGSRVVRASERPMGRMQALGFCWHYLKAYRTVDDDLQSIDAVTVKDIRQTLTDFPIHEPTIVALGPVKDLPPVDGPPQP
jgi:predicted Zn-dependent peptidase